jgi:putative ABC transport system substrate-binding protein
MKRRDFLALAGAAAAAWPLAARSQTTVAKRVGFAFILAEDDPITPLYAGELRLGLANEWVEGSNLVVQSRWNSNTTEAARANIEELIRFRPDVLVVVGSASLTQAARMTQSIPIVFAFVPESVASATAGPNFARPTRNITGWINTGDDIGSKWVELLLELAPDLRRIVYLENAANISAPFPHAAKATAEQRGVEFAVLPFRRPSEISRGLADQPPRTGLLISEDGILLANRRMLYAEVGRFKLPAVWGHVVYATDGVPVAYAIDNPSQLADAAAYAGHILSGARVGDLPIQFPRRYRLIVNIKQARDQNLSVPQTVLARADEIAG